MGFSIKGLFRKRSVSSAIGISSSDADRKLVLGIAGRRWPSLKQIKHLGRYLSGSERHILAIALLVALVGTGLVVTKYFLDHLVTRPAPGGDYVEATVGEPRFINPILANGNDNDADLVALIFSGLMRVDSSGKLMTDLADSYEVSADGKIYTFKLREGMLWHDGTAFSAMDVVETVDDIKDPAWNSPYLAQFKNVKAESPDERTIVFTLSEPYAPFLSALTIGILPDHLWHDIPPETAARSEINLKPIGTGPFRFKSLTKDKRGVVTAYSLVRNENYYGQKAYLSSISFDYYSTYSEAAEALRNKQADGVSYLPPEFREEMSRTRAVRLYELRLSEVVAVFLNSNKQPMLRSKAVRQALNTAIDRETILEAAPTGNMPALGPITVGLTGFNPGIKKFSLDLAAAEKMLDDEGWKRGADGWRQKDSKDAAGKVVPQIMSLSITVPDSQDLIAAAQQIERDWRTIGIKADLQIAPLGKFKSDIIRPRDYDALIYGELLGAEPDLFPFWHSSQVASPGLNLAGFVSRRADELLEKSRITVKPEEREAYFKELQDLIVDESLALFLYSPTYSYAISRVIKGVETGVIFSPAGRFASVTNWYVNSERKFGK